MFYNRNNMHIVQVFSSCARVIEVVKRCRASSENFWEEIFSTPTHGFLIIFRCLLFEPQNIFDAPPTFDSDPKRGLTTTEGQIPIEVHYYPFPIDKAY